MATYSNKGARLKLLEGIFMAGVHLGRRLGIVGHHAGNLGGREGGREAIGNSPKIVDWDSWSYVGHLGGGLG